ncbi:unnamed protein product [Menidia menidia]|uniref:(Atlantic silverside) hypothetical protein n=1 Tax=Menidia menidia TaxID=238744 RepID=A0A8S4BL32_9TELE|nr:unnamed protein product [Menidia menidia]
MIRINNPQYFHFLQQADALRHSGSLCDAIISVKRQTFRAHRLVLACASRTLAQQLAQRDADSPVHCTLDYFSPHTFQQVLDFTYTQALEVPVKDLQQLLRAAQLLEMQPLEEQCRRQLGIISKREQDGSGEITDLEEKKCLKDNDTKHTGAPVPEDQEASPPEDASASTVVDNLSPIDPNSQNSPKPSSNKARVSPPKSAYCSRDSVITRPTSSTSSFYPSWAFPVNMWESEMHMNALRRIAENYSNLMAAHPLQSSNPSVVYPFSLSSPPMFPLLSPQCQTPPQSSAINYSGFHPRYSPDLYNETPRIGSLIKNSLLKRKKSSQRRFTGTLQSKQSYPEGPKARTERAEDCQHCSARLPDDPVLQESAAAQLGKSCAGCPFCGKGYLAPHETETREDHRGEKPYQCQHCSKQFSLKHQLDTHLRVHTGEKPFECRLCGQRSRDYSAMIKHLRTHGGAAPYQCTVCLEFCSSLVAMQRHVKTHAVQDFPPDWSINNTYLYISHI